MLDLSAGGCRIESPVTVEPGMSLELRIYAPDIEWPLMIEATNVHRVSGQTFGLAFSRITETEQERLGQVISALMKASWYERAPTTLLRSVVPAMCLNRRYGSGKFRESCERGRRYQQRPEARKEDICVQGSGLENQ